MEFEFEKRDEGYRVTLGGEFFCSVQCRSFSTTVADKKAVDKVNEWEKPNWEIHFSGRPMKPGVLDAFLRALDKLTK